jgi:phosphoglycerate dehydrogenase-like enzyme
MTRPGVQESAVRRGWGDLDVLIAHTKMAKVLHDELDGTPGVRLHVGEPDAHRPEPGEAGSYGDGTCGEGTGGDRTRGDGSHGHGAGSEGAPGPADPYRTADVVVGYQFPPGSLAGYPRLRWLHLTGTGTDHLAAAGLPPGVLVTTSARVPVDAVAEYAVAGLLHLLKALPDLGRGPGGAWYRSDALMLGGSTVAVVGAGRIGRAVLRRLAALGARTVAVTRPGRTCPVPGADRTVPSDRLAEVAATADHLVLCLPGGPGTRLLAGERVLAALPPHGTVVNVGRAETLDTRALYAALRAGRLRGAFLDVHDTEPLPADDPAWHVPGLVVSPHRAFAFPDEPAQVAQAFLANLHDLRALRSPRDITLWHPEPRATAPADDTDSTSRTGERTAQ